MTLKCYMFQFPKELSSGNSHKTCITHHFYKFVQCTLVTSLGVGKCSTGMSFTEHSFV